MSSFEQMLEYPYLYTCMIRNTYAILFDVGELVNPDENLLIFSPHQAYVCMLYLMEVFCSVSL